MAHHDTVICCEYGKLIQSCHEIPASGDVASDEDTKGEDGERVHELPASRWHTSPMQIKLRANDCMKAVDAVQNKATRAKVGNCFDPRDPLLLRKSFSGTVPHFERQDRGLKRRRRLGRLGGKVEVHFAHFTLQVVKYRGKDISLLARLKDYYVFPSCIMKPANQSSTLYPP